VQRYRRDGKKTRERLNKVLERIALPATQAMQELSKPSPRVHFDASCFCRRCPRANQDDFLSGSFFLSSRGCRLGSKEGVRSWAMAMAFPCLAGSDPIDPGQSYLVSETSRWKMQDTMGATNGGSNLGCSCNLLYQYMRCPRISYHFIWKETMCKWTLTSKICNFAPPSPERRTTRFQDAEHGSQGLGEHEKYAQARYDGHSSLDRCCRP